ncbi:MAG: hypothetical protein KC619_09650 [Myxococcales bacterium]|nr:hypothetical protein [Myxococcales bacterium]
MRMSFLSCSVLLVLGAGCDGAPTGVDAGGVADGGIADSGVPTDGGSPLPPEPVIGGMLGEYEVPIDGPLSAYARYQITDVHWFHDPDRNRMVLEYTLPAEMIGTPHFLDLDGADGDLVPPIAVAGAAGTGVCEQSGTRMTCTEMLTGVPVDLPAIEAAEATGTLPPERAAVSRHFASDPIGILRFELP